MNPLATVYVGTSQMMSQLADGSARLIIESPPYERQQACCGAPSCLTSHHGAEFVRRFAEFLPERLRVLRDDGSYVVNFAAQVIDGFTSPSEFLLPKAISEAGFRLVQSHHWVKSNAAPTAPDSRVKNSHEFFWHFAKGPGYYFDKDSIRQPHLYADRDPRRKRYHSLGKDPGNAILPLAEQVNRLKSPYDNVLVMTKSNDQSLFAHPGKMRDGLAERFIRLLSAPGDLVVDGFNGTGQTGVEALALGRRYAGYEIHEEHAKLSRKRLGIVDEVTVEQENTPMDNRLMDIKRAAVYLGKTEEALRSLVKRNKIPSGKQGARIVFDRHAIDAWIQEGIQWRTPGGATQPHPAPSA